MQADLVGDPGEMIAARELLEWTSDIGDHALEGWDDGWLVEISSLRITGDFTPGYARGNHE